MAEHLILTENNIPVTSSAAPTIGTNGDSTLDLWRLNPVSLTLVAWMTASETNINNAGVRRTTNPANWENLNLSGASVNMSIEMTWNAPAGGKTPHHYSLYAQNLSAYDFDVNQTKLGECAGYLTTFDFTTYDGNIQAVFGATTPSITLNPIMQMEPRYRQKSKRGYNGKAYKKSWASDTLVDTLEMLVTQMSTFKDADLTKAHQGATQILSWLDNAVPLKLAEVTVADPDEDPYVATYYGAITGFDYLASKGKNSKTEFVIIFEVESEDKV